MKTLPISAAVLALLVGAVAAAAQLPQASAATLDRGHDPTAVGGGFAAIASNPAGLALPESPSFSMVLPSVSASAGLGPVTLGDLTDWEGRLLPVAAKNEWLGLIAESGRQTGNANVGATGLALTVGPLGVQVSGRAAGTVDLSEGAAELLLYGNAGRTGTATDLDLAESLMDGFAVTTVALSFGFTATDGLYLGATGKYSIGAGLALGRNQGTFVTADPLEVEVDFPVLIPATDPYEFNQGSGLGLDLGAILEGDPVRLGITVENVFNTFEWDLSGFSYVPGQALFNEDESDSDFDEVPLDSAPAAIREEFQALADELKPETRVSVGASLAALPALRLYANVQKSVTDGMSFDPDFYGGVGAEFTGVSFFHLRGHGAVITDGYQLGAGASLVLGPVRLTGGAAMRSESSHDSVLGTFALSFGSH